MVRLGKTGMLLLAAAIAAMPALASAATVNHSWMATTGVIGDLKAIDPAITSEVFNRTGSYALGTAPPGYVTTPVTDYKSYAYFQSHPASTHWVLYDNEKWSFTPVNEQKNPGLYMKDFATLAHQRGEQVIMTPARDLVAVSGAVCVQQPGETMDDAYIRCNIPGLAASGGGNVVEIQAQADQGSVSAYSSLVSRAKAEVTTGVPVWAGVTTDRGDPVSAMVNCYNAVQASIQGVWLNSSSSTITVADQFLKSISP